MKTLSENEIWKDVINYKGYYQISSIGNVRSLTRKVNHPLGGKKIVYGKSKPTHKSPAGYKQVVFYKNCKDSLFLIHLLVWDHFGDTKRNGRILQIDHKDDNKINNNIDNLQVLTASQNIQKYYDTKITASKYPRVYLDKRANRWEASLRINGKNKYIGRFDTEDEAHEANLEYKNSLETII